MKSKINGVNLSEAVIASQMGMDDGIDRDPDSDIALTPQPWGKDGCISLFLYPSLAERSEI
jgi:hypothetical protein